MLRIQNLNKIIDQKMILADLNFTQQPGEIIGLVGRNGAGKTTLLRCLAGQYLIDAGDILINNTSIKEQPALKNQLFYLDEAQLFFKNSCLSQIGRFYQQAYPTFDNLRFQELLVKFQLDQSNHYQQLSKGRQGLFNIILAISSHAQYLLLDEPFDGLDIIVRKNVIRLLLDSVSERQTSLLITSHNLKELEQLIDRTLILKEQRIVQDYQLETLRQTDRKLQIVLKTNQVPSLFKTHGRLLSIAGRVMIVYFHDYTPELAQQIQALEPVLCEALPITLEDLFEANLLNEADYQVFV